MQSPLTTLNNYNHPIYGIGTHAYKLLSPARYLPRYRIWCGRETADVENYRTAGLKVDSFEQKLSRIRKKMHNTGLLKSRTFRTQILKTQGPVQIFVQKPTIRVEQMCQEKGWQLLANAQVLSTQFEQKGFFRTLVKSLNLPVIPSEQIALADFIQPTVLKRLEQSLGNQWVVQWADVIGAGGMSTHYLQDPREIETVLRKAKTLKNQPQYIQVSQYLPQTQSITVAGCVTHQGVLVSPPWTQVIDQVLGYGERPHGKFGGNDWAVFKPSKEVIQKIRQYVQNIGEAMATAGYRGIFGVDLLLDPRTEEVYPLECNARYVGSYPVYSWLQLAQGEVPIEAYHWLEWLDLPFEVDLDRQMDQWQTPISAAQLILFNPFTDQTAQITRALNPGVYRYQSDQFIYVGSEYDLTQLDDSATFILGGAVPIQAQVIGPGSRIGKLDFPHGILDVSGRLKPEIREIVDAVYRHLEIQPTEVRGAVHVDE